MYSFPDLEPVCCSMSSSNCFFLTCMQISQGAGQVVRYFHLFKNFPQSGIFHRVPEELWTDGGSWHCTGGSDQDHPQEKEVQKGKMVVRGGLTNSYEKKRLKRQRRRPGGMGWRGRREGGWGWGTHVNPWLIHVNVWQKPLQYCKVISLQLIKINE